VRNHTPLTRNVVEKTAGVGNSGKATLCRPYIRRRERSLLGS